MKSFLHLSTTSAATANADNFQSPVANGAGGWNSTITAFFEQPFPHATTLDRLRVKVKTAPGTGKNIVYTLMVNGVASASTCTISGAATTAQDLTHTVSISQGDLVSLRAHPDTGFTASVATYASIRQDATGKTAVLGSANTTSLGQFSAMGTQAGTLATGDAGIQVPAGTWSNLFVVSTASAANFTVFKNGSAQTLTTGAMAAATGNDTTHSFTTVDGDRVSIANSGTGRVSSWGMTFTPTTDGTSFIGFVSGGNTPTSATNFYEPLGVGTGAWNATETNVQMIVQASTLTGIFAETSVSPGVSPKAYAFTARQNAADTTAAVTVNDASSSGNDGSGRQAHTTGQNIALSDDDLVTIKVVPSGTPTGLHAYGSLFLFVAPGGTSSILKVSGVARASISKTSGVALASIGKVGGLA